MVKKNKTVIVVTSVFLALLFAFTISCTSMSVAGSTIKLNKDRVTLTTGKTVQLKLKNAKAKKVKWKSKNKKIAVVKAGFVTAKKAGKTTVIATYKKKKYKCEIVVEKTEKNSDGDEMLVVCYSWSKNTKHIAERIAQNIHADLYEIQTVKAYPKDGYETSDIAQEERRTGKLPEIKDNLPDLKKYDTVIIGGPIWNAYIATPLARYLELTDFSGKTVIPFSTSQGSGQNSYLKDFKEWVKNPKDIGKYKDIRFPDNYSPDAFSDGEIDDMLMSWLKENNLYRNKSAGEVVLNSGYKMPVLGLGTWTQDDKTVEDSVYEAIKDGYRLIDTAQYYDNEAGVGNGVRKAMKEGIVSRGDIFITTKVMPGNYDRAYKSIDESLDRLGFDYIDLMLVHQSGTNDDKVYKALCQGVKDGKIRSVGISNYYTAAEVKRVTEGTDIQPAVIQNENHPYYQNTKLKEYAKKQGIVIESYYPLGGRGHTQDLFSDPTIDAIAKAHGKTPAQIILRWHIQAGYITIPGSSNPEHIAENIDIFDFELSEDEMKMMESLDTGERYESW